jgi:hypothetical protein
MLVEQIFGPQLQVELVVHQQRADAQAGERIAVDLRGRIERDRGVLGRAPVDVEQTIGFTLSVISWV